MGNYRANTSDLLLFLSATGSWAAPSLRCEGIVDHSKEQTIVIIEKETDDYSVRYPELSNIKTELIILYSSDRRLIFSAPSKWGVGIWYINLNNTMFSYIQTKDISEFAEAQNLNFDIYHGISAFLD